METTLEQIKKNAQDSSILINDIIEKLKQLQELNNKLYEDNN